MILNRISHWCKNASLFIFALTTLGCSQHSMPEISFQESLDQAQNPYQFSISAYNPDDLKFLKQNNIELNTAQNRITVAEALYSQAFAGYLPQLSTDFSVNRQSFVDPFNFQPQDKLTLYSLGGQISFVPDFFGRTQLRTNIADNQLLANYAQAQATYLDILNGYSKNYHLVCATKQLLDINDDTVTLNRNLLNSTKVRYEMGRTNAVNYYSAIDRLKSAEIAQKQAQQNYNLALQSYYSLIGKSVPQENTLCENGLAPLPSGHITISVTDLDQRPDIKVAQYNIQITSDTKDLSIKAFYPDPAIIFSANNINTDFEKLFNIGGFASNIIGQLTQMIYDGGVRSSQIDISEADLTLAKQTYQDTLIKAGNNIMTVGQNLTLAMRLEEKAEQRLEAAKAAFEAANRRYQYGRIPFQDLLSIQMNYYAARIDMIILQQNVHDLYSDLLTASGVTPIRVEL